MTSVEQHQSRTEALAATTATQALTVYAAYQAGQLTRDQAVALIAAIVNQANAAAVSLADAGLSVQIEHATGSPAPATGITPTDAAERLHKAVDTILDEQQPDPEQPDSTQMRIERLARAEPLEAAQNATIDAMQKQPLVEGWTRHRSPGCCLLCTWWWREGRIWPKEHPFQSHKGCNCTPKVVLAEHIESTVYTRRLKRNEQPRTTS
ncbi:hypothetical protein [Mycobacterium paraffinicum]|uniref:DUF222 domain-containing protein n=1 Tax=Mycobacterium paraffinicum TaxID=53378 RepID=A0ABP8F465_9MYCO|nr:hypothetical protein [Mycobacterium paraffinicum]MCV7311026.1 hypothetical protein [Mycobacterium paraffinicum]